MATKPEALPSVDDDLALPAEPRRQRPNLAALRSSPDLPDDAVRANSLAIGEKWGASTRLQTPPPTTPLESLRLDVPDYLARELRVKCAEMKVTNAYLVMRALAKDGFHVDDKDLVPDRYKRGKR
jgi:hypothetical protein